MVTLKELAKLLHVSVSTVSKALSDSSEIGESTKKRVLELAKELNYKPNRVAQQLKSSKTKVIGVVVPSLINPFFAEVLHGIETAIAKADYDMIVCISNESLAKEKRSLDLLANGSVDGFLVAVARETQVKQSYEHLKSINASVPIVMFDRVVNEIECNKVIVNDFQTVYDATKYLITNENRKNIILISNVEELSVGKYRIDGYTKAVVEENLRVNILKVANQQNQKQYIYNFLKDNPKTDAIISIDHITGIMALNMLQELNKVIPKDVSVVGFDYSGSELVSHPKLSVIDQKPFEIGKQTAELLLQSLNEKEKIPLKTIVVSSELNLNDTTI